MFYPACRTHKEPMMRLLEIVGTTFSLGLWFLIIVVLIQVLGIFFNMKGDY